MDNNEPLVITNRELQEINFALEYNERYNHGTDGHNRLNLIAKFARHLGFERGSDEIPRMATVPPGVVIDDGPTTGMQTAGR